MKKTVVALFLVLLLFTIVSCQKSDSVCYYAYFPDNAFVLLYSESRNKLYHISIPIESIMKWGANEGIASAPEAVRHFVGMEEDGFIMGNSQSLEACREMLDAFSEDKSHTLSSRLTTLVKNAPDFLTEPAMGNINRLCGTDMAALLKAVSDKDTECEILDSSNVMKDNLEFSAKYFRIWLSQIVK